MRRYLVGFGVIAVVVASAYAVVAGVQHSKSCATSGEPAVAGSCSPSGSDKREISAGAIRGNFDPAMSGVCRFACATKLKYKAADVLAQPGAMSGKLTQCPVSGVVFVVDVSRPTVSAAGNEYITCCGNCAEKLRRDPSHYLKV